MSEAYALVLDRSAVRCACVCARANFSAQLAGSGIATLGLFHRLALSFGAHAGQAVLCLFAACGGGLIGESIRPRGELRIFAALFVVGSAFNFQAWDKYLLDVLPIVLLAIFAARTEVAAGEA